MPVGMRVMKRKRAASLDVINRFRSLPIANISDSMSRMSEGGAKLRPLHAGGELEGPAVIVKDRPCEENVPIGIAGMAIAPDDQIFGDHDCKVSMSYNDVEKPYAFASSKHAKRTAQLVGIARGLCDRKWVDQAQTSAGNEIKS